MITDFFFSPGHDLAFLLPALIYVCLIVVISLTAVFSSKPASPDA